MGVALGLLAAVLVRKHIDRDKITNLRTLVQSVSVSNFRVVRSGTHRRSRLSGARPVMRMLVSRRA